MSCPVAAVLAHVVPEARRRQNLGVSSLRQNVSLSTPEVLTRRVRWIGLQVERELPQDLLDRRPVQCREHCFIEASPRPRTAVLRPTEGGGRNLGRLTFSLPSALRHAETARDGPYRARKR